MLFCGQKYPFKKIPNTVQLHISILYRRKNIYAMKHLATPYLITVLEILLIVMNLTFFIIGFQHLTLAFKFLVWN